MMLCIVLKKVGNADSTSWCLQDRPEYMHMHFCGSNMVVKKQFLT